MRNCNHYSCSWRREINCDFVTNIFYCVGEWGGVVLLELGLKKSGRGERSGTGVIVGVFILWVEDQHRNLPRYLSTTCVDIDFVDIFNK